MARLHHGTRAWFATAVAIAVAGCGAVASAPSLSPSPAPTQATTAPATSPSLIPVSIPTPTAPVVAAGESWIAFQQFPGRSELVLVRPDGSGLHRPTRDLAGGDQTNPDWSPDGSRLVFGLTSGSRDDLWVVGAGGDDAHLLLDCEAPCAWFDDPAWSPDGASVLYSRVTDVDGAQRATLERIDVASGEVDVIATAAPTDFYAGQRWSPDGDAVVLEVVHRVNESLDSDIDGVTLAIIDLADPAPAGRQLVAPDLWPETAAWAPDGSEIVFAARPEPDAAGTDLYAIRPDGTGLRRLTTLVSDGGNATHPEVSRDGSEVVFAAHFPGDGPTVLAAVGKEGGAVRPATGGTAYVDGVHPRFRPVP